MGKQGPCYHCGTQTTPLWRNGPPEKPVLCNACGSRYRIRGSLANYAPKHAQGQPVAKRRRISCKIAPKNGTFKVDENLTTHTCYSTGSDDSASNKSSSESALSYPQCCYKIKEEEEDEIPGLTQESLWKSSIPSRKRSLANHRNLSPIEKLQKDLCNILKHEDPSILSKTEEDVLIYNPHNLQISCNEIGLGSFPLKPNTIPIELAPLVTHSSLVDIKPSLIVNANVSGFNEPQNISSFMDELEKIESDDDGLESLLHIKEELLSTSWMELPL